MNSSLPSSLHFIKNIPYQLKISPAIGLFLISISSPKFLSALSIIVSIVILPLFPLYPRFSLHTANFTLLKLLSTAFTMTSLSQLANTNFLLLYFLIFLPPSTLSIIIFFCLASLLTLVSLVLHFLSSHLIFSIALSLFPFNLASLLLLPSLLASLRVQSLVLFSSAYILRLSLTFFQTPLFRIIFMLMILNSTSPSLLQILFLIFTSFLLRLILSLIGLLQIASLLIPLKLNSSYWHSSTAFKADLIHSSLSRNLSVNCFILSQPWSHP